MNNTQYDFEVGHDTDLDDWITVRSPDVAHSFEVKIKEERGAVVVVGLRLDQGHVVTSRELRSIRLGSIGAQLSLVLEELAVDFRETVERARRELDFYNPTMTAEQYEDWEPEAILLKDLAWAQEGAARYSVWSWKQRTSATDVWLKRGRGASPPSEHELRAFAEVYLSERAQSSHGAVTRASSRVGVNRATAHRWINRCEALGLLPQREVRA